MQATVIRYQWRPDTEGGDFAQKCYSASHYYDKIPGIILKDKMFVLAHGFGGSSHRMEVWTSNGVLYDSGGGCVCYRAYLPNTQARSHKEEETMVP